MYISSYYGKSRNSIQSQEIRIDKSKAGGFSDPKFHDVYFRDEMNFGLRIITASQTQNFIDRQAWLVKIVNNDTEFFFWVIDNASGFIQFNGSVNEIEKYRKLVVAIQ